MFFLFSHSFYENKRGMLAGRLERDCEEGNTMKMRGQKCKTRRRDVESMCEICPERRKGVSSGGG